MMPNPPKSRLPLLSQPDRSPRPGTPPKPVANDNPQAEAEPPLPEPLLGSWRDGHFEFTSPAARETWHRSAYAQGINPQNWHQGIEIDDRTHEVIKAGFGGPTPPYYRGPDGKHRFGNLNTIEPPELRDIRARHFRGRSIDDLETTFAATGKMPGEDEAVAHLQPPPHRPQPAALSTNAAAILGGMEQARQTKPEIIATLARADTGNATDGKADADPKRTPPVTLELSPKPEKKRATPGHGGGTAPTPKRDYQQLPEPVPPELSIGKATEGKAEWPIIPKDWVTQDNKGREVLKLEYSDGLDSFKEAMIKESEKYTRRTKKKLPNLDVDAGALMRHYLEGNGEAVQLEPTPQLLAGDNIQSANNGLNNHIREWLIDPDKTKQPSEQLAPKLRQLKDGETVSVGSTWDGATDLVGDHPFEVIAREFGHPRENDFVDRSEPHLAALGHVQVHGEAAATVTRQGNRYFVSVDITKTIKDVYDYTDDGGEEETNDKINDINQEPENQQDPWLPVDTAKLNILAMTGRAKPFEVVSSPWQERYTVELQWVPSATRGPHGPGHFEIVPNTEAWQRTAAPDNNPHKP